MEFLKLDLNIYWDLMLPMIIIIFIAGIYGIINKSQLINFDKYLALFKIVFYLILAALTISLDVTVVNDKVNINLIIPDKLTLGQLLLITLSVLEAGSNLVLFLKVPKSEFHLLSKDEFWEYRYEDFLKGMRTNDRIIELEKEIENMKRRNLNIKSLSKKKKRGKRRKK